MPDDRRVSSCGGGPADEIAAIGARDFVNACLAAGECHSIRTALQKKGIDTKVKMLLRNMKLSMKRNTERNT